MLSLTPITTETFPSAGEKKATTVSSLLCALDLVDEGFEFFRRNVFDDLGDEFDAVDGFEFVPDCRRPCY